MRIPVALRDPGQRQDHPAARTFLSTWTVPACGPSFHFFRTLLTGRSRTLRDVRQQAPSVGDDRPDALLRPPMTPEDLRRVPEVFIGVLFVVHVVDQPDDAPLFLVRIIFS